MRSIILIAMLLGLGAMQAVAQTDTIEVSYDTTPDVRIAGIFMHITWRIASHEKNQVSHLRRVDAAGFPILNRIMDSITLSSTIDPHAIIPYVQRHSHRSHIGPYVRLQLTKMIDMYRGVSSPIRIRLAFDTSGWLTYAEFRGFVTLRDGYTLSNDELRPFNFHRQEFVEYGL